MNHMSSQPPTIITHMFSMGLDRVRFFASPLHRQSPLSNRSIELVITRLINIFRAHFMVAWAAVTSRHMLE